jgi:hypothetical protein
MLWLSHSYRACWSIYYDDHGFSSNRLRSGSADACSYFNDVPTRPPCIPDYTRVTEADSGSLCKPKHITGAMRSWRSIAMGRRSIQRNTTSDSTAYTMPDLDLALRTVHMTVSAGIGITSRLSPMHVYLFAPEHFLQPHGAQSRFALQSCNTTTQSQYR